MLDQLEWPSLDARRDRSSLLLFHKIHSGAVSIEKDKYMTPAHSRVLGNAESCVFLRQPLFCTHFFPAGDSNFWFCTQFFPAGDSNLRQLFFC